MDFFNKVEETISVKGKAVMDKAKEMTEVASLKSQIGTCEEVIKKNYAEIGKMYYEKFGDNPEELFAKQCRAIKNAQAGIADLEQKIKDIKGI